MGGTYAKEHLVWRNLLDRCYNPESAGWKHYGAKGIGVAKAWRDDFERFLKDIGAAPDRRRSTWLARLDVTKDFEPGNCIWTTRNEQQNRRAFCQHVTVHGQRMTIAQAARLPQLPSSATIHKRHRLGIPQETPPVPAPKRPAVVVVDGCVLTVKEIAGRLGVSPKAILHRIRSGWTPAQIIGREKHQGVAPAKK
ncbi:hypothetical protein [Zoogloea sp.]|uniref:hypothetical protein n=1 Tax=Zoogloea sp. TaxID=49181 RepID=UPI001AC8DE72|nr:hypothetical protein [Zoogloea sp.]MBN8285464.1 hypothetical protein [Zoogloea sp.]